ncbi:[protein-PII] uridylyltransferase [Pseudoruegeria sp. SK021]|uniref:[protein-PII] uridylyltransferase n=1 Tax=Pseudoruegeria sp. SK021 TaxID=1933035 RepID=UPI000A2258E3|nr:[protein-PII] uridylyltransferase [Pseudoruegeria sp. SK021]OSP56071.1 [protein-PII] uridylyltransferase [Pseudoruegeria sp. SK021]
MTLRLEPRPTELICDPSAICDEAALLAALAQIAADEPDTTKQRPAVIQTLQQARTQGAARIADGIQQRPLDARAAVRSYAYLTDCLVKSTYWMATTHIHPTPSAKTSEGLAVVAVGGYGRAEMSPYSDVDLLFLTPYKITGWAESVIETMLYILWDLHLKVGHASRTVSDCLRLGRDDYTIRTALLECRFIEGNAPLASDLRDRLRRELFRDTAPDFIEAKLEERSQRHQKNGGRRYVVEPNVKEGKGGLRDLQTLFWIAKYVHGVDDPQDLVDLGVFTPEEFGYFDKAENFLWAIRNQLHLISSRAMDLLSFDLQVEVADHLGYIDRAGRRGVEHFMQDYFRHATRVGDLTRIFLTAMEAQHIKRLPTMASLFKRRIKLKPGFKLVQNRLTVADEAEFLEDRRNLLRAFDETIRTGLPAHPDLARLIVANLDLIDDQMRRDPEAARIFLNLLLKRGDPARALHRMNETGVLGAFLPEFQPVVAMMQFNMYHHYTVDEHTIQCIGTLAKIERGEMTEDLPISTSIMHGDVNRRVLYLALLLHDIGKGRPEDHAVLGARIARRVAPRLGLKPQESATVEWLVRYHLLMSDMAQKRDVSDPRTVRDFAKAVKTQKRLDMLMVLTTCDIIGVGPGVWNNWKAMLLRNLYRLTSEALATGLEDVNRESRESEAKSALRAALPDWDKAALRRETSRHYGPYWQGLQTETQVVFAKLLDGIGNGEIRIDLKQDEDRDATRVSFAMADHPGIFARLAGSLALSGANVVDARTYTSKDGYATPVFWIQDADGAPYSPDRQDRLRAMIHKILNGEVVTSEAMVARDRIKKRERAFRHPTSIAFDNEGSDIYTIIEVDTRDRAGLLYDLARTLAGANIYIASAQIATYGAQAVDTFYVKDMFGLKIMSNSKIAGLEKKLLAAIEQGANKAAR